MHQDGSLTNKMHAKVVLIKRKHSLFTHYNIAERLWIAANLFVYKLPQ